METPPLYALSPCSAFLRRQQVSASTRQGPTAHCPVGSYMMTACISTAQHTTLLCVVHPTQDRACLSVSVSVPQARASLLWHTYTHHRDRSVRAARQQYVLTRHPAVVHRMWIILRGDILVQRRHACPTATTCTLPQQPHPSTETGHGLSLANHVSA